MYALFLLNIDCGIGPISTVYIYIYIYIYIYTICSDTRVEGSVCYAMFLTVA